MHKEIFVIARVISIFLLFSFNLPLNGQPSRYFYENGMNLSDDKLAIAEFSKAINYDNNYAEAYFQRGKRFFILNYLNESLRTFAIKDVNIAITLKPSYIEAFNFRAYIKSLNGDHFGAVSDYTEVLKIDSLLPYVFYNRGQAKISIKNYFGALDDFIKAINLKPDYYNAIIGRGDALSSLDLENDAIFQYTNAININLKLPEAYYKRGLSKLKLMQKQSGCLDLSKAGELGDYTAYNSIKIYCN
jgi:tetratricopeptide (TPR) repeat protein